MSRVDCTERSECQVKPGVLEMKILATCEKILATSEAVRDTPIDIVEQGGMTFTRGSDGTIYPSGSLTRDLARQLYEANQIVETLPVNERGDRITLGSEWWLRRTDSGEGCGYSWHRAIVIELRHQRSSVEVLIGGHRSVVEIDRLFKEKPKPKIEEEIQKLKEEISQLGEEMETKVDHLRKQLTKLQGHSAFKNIS